MAKIKNPPKRYMPLIKCPYCDSTHRNMYNLRRHYTNCHPDKHPYDVEYQIVRQRNPRLDIDLLLVRYLDKKETVIGLQKQGIFVKHFLQNIGVCRVDKADKGLCRAKAVNSAPEEMRLANRVKSSLTRLKTAGVQNIDELEEAITALRTIEHVKRKIAKELEPPKEPEAPESLYLDEDAPDYRPVDDPLKPNR